MLGCTEMTLVPSGALRVMKSKSLKWEHTEDTCHGLNTDSQVHLILAVSEEGNYTCNLDSWSLQETVQIVTVLYTRNTMSYWIKHISNQNQQPQLEAHSQSTLAIITLSNSTIKSGTKEIDTFMTVLLIQTRNLSTIFFIRSS